MRSLLFIESFDLNKQSVERAVFYAIRVVSRKEGDKLRDYVSEIGCFASAGQQDILTEIKHRKCAASQSSIVNQMSTFKE
jgi:hypothetical protein